ncbi:restriction endonuclease [Salinivibrio sp. ES.052]|uniref:restriction endonuclease n=1 Tax=Salinivibrio sp. ES.052 TaxID=1882823 RepID=UPI000926931B|nr:restriction endonuclease [Salinivibrio sp. ES.052]SIO38163.1 restriction system protein [Salinivibrio sp. ES.052]
MQLRSWQQNFVDQYLSSDAQKSLLIAVTGTGKTITALSAAKGKIEKGDVSRVVVVSDRKMLQYQWAHVAREIGMEIDTTFGQRSASLTYQSIIRSKKEFEEVVTGQDSIFIFDEAAKLSKRTEDLGEEVLRQNPNSKLLYLSSIPVRGHTFDWTHEIGREFIYQPEIIRLPETQIEIARYSPSILLLEQLRAPGFSLESLSWRQFEILISRLLEADGYEIELMNGTKDGGVDIVAVKDMKEAGLYKALWQAKKYKTSSKVGISAIRELADVRNEFGASKGILVTTSFLTRGALDRVYRDKYILGKVDRNDLGNWINRQLFE